MGIQRTITIMVVSMGVLGTIDMEFGYTVPYMKARLGTIGMVVGAICATWRGIASALMSIAI